MGDMLETVIPKSDQLNFDDFIGGETKTIKITAAKVTGGDQPATLNFVGDNGKPYKPCKSMRRVLIEVWGRDSQNYVGKSMTLYGDPTVKFGGAVVGGIRISHMSHMDAPRTLALTVTKANKKPYKVLPLKIDGDKKEEKVIVKDEKKDGVDRMRAHFRATLDPDADYYADAEHLEKEIEAFTIDGNMAAFKEIYPDHYDNFIARIEATKTRLKSNKEETINE